MDSSRDLVNRHRILLELELQVPRDLTQLRVASKPLQTDSSRHSRSHVLDLDNSRHSPLSHLLLVSNREVSVVHLDRVPQEPLDKQMPSQLALILTVEGLLPSLLDHALHSRIFSQVPVPPWVHSVALPMHSVEPVQYLGPDLAMYHPNITPRWALAPCRLGLDSSMVACARKQHQLMACRYLIFQGFLLRTTLGLAIYSQMVCPMMYVTTRLVGLQVLQRYTNRW